MKVLVVVALLSAICAASNVEDTCYTQINGGCESTDSLTAYLSKAENPLCNSRYGGIGQIELEVQAYINFQLSKSYEYLLLATQFSSYKKNRPGFQKLYQSLSDRSFDDTIDMIKQLTRRGGKVDFNTKHKIPVKVSKDPVVLEVHELQSLAMALDNEKELANGAFHLHNAALHVHNAKLHGPNHLRDPEMAQYVEEKLLGKQAETIRKISGYANDLTKMMDEPNTSSLAIYLFDEYLQKQ